jgi:AraC-like DNA-binding protein
MNMRSNAALNGEIPTTPDQSRIEIVSITSLAQRGAWRTAAMRSYSSPRLLWITKGQGRITMNGQTRGYGPNNLIYIPPNTLFGYEAGVHTYGTQVALPTHLATLWPDAPIHLRLRDVHVQKEMMQMLDNLEREHQAGTPAATRAAEFHAGLISVFMERQMESTPEQALPETPSSRIVASYTRLIAQNYSLAKGVAGYAQELGVTPTHLTRCCQQTCGRSALKLLNDRILYEARERLIDGPTPVSRIASDLGFGSAAYFTRAFQAATGLTPSAFRDRHTAPKRLQ